MPDSQKPAPKKRVTKKDPADSRPPIPYAEEIKLWVRSGGRCALCNKYLLEDERYVYDVRTGEMAHVVGWKDSAKSPRGKNSLPADERNKAENLMLLCASDHQFIDKKKVEGDFSVERLQREKREHEERIYHLTGLPRDRETVVVRVLGSIRGATPELSREHARDVVFREEDRYARFPLSFHQQDAEVDLTRIGDPENGWEAYWQVGRSTIDTGLGRVADGVRGGMVRHLSVFGLARIPLLIYLGYCLDDKVPATIYQKHRDEDESWGWPERDSTVEFEVRQVRSGTDAGNVALLLSLSGSVSVEELPPDVDASFSVFEIRPTSGTPHRSLLRSRASLKAFADTYHGFLASLEVTHKAAREIHLFPAIPVSAAMVCGRGIMRDAQPAIHVYDRTGQTYKLALTVNQ